MRYFVPIFDIWPEIGNNQSTESTERRVYNGIIYKIQDLFKPILSPGGALSVQKVKGMKSLNNRIHELYKEKVLQAFGCDIYE